MECESNGCALGTAEMVERLDAWRAISSQATARTVEPTKITSVYPSEPLLVQRLRDLIAAEAVCCPVLEFNLRQEAGRTILELEFPEDARGLVDAVMAGRSRLPETQPRR